MIKTKCVICNHSKAIVVYRVNFKESDITPEIFSARRLPDKIHYRMVRCKTCGLLYSNPILPAEKIEILYKKSFVTYDEQVKNLNKTYGYYLRQASKYLEKKGRLLEIGCGNGFFLLYAKKNGYKEVWGVEPGKESVKKAVPSIRSKIIVDIFRPKQFKNDYFDVVCMFQTLDHLPKPNEVLRGIYKILKPGGVFLAIQHDISSWSAKLLGERSPIIDIEHTYLYDPKTLKKLFLNNHYQVVDLFSVKSIHTISYWFYLTPLPGWIKETAIETLDKLGLGQRTIEVYAGNLGIIAKKPFKPSKGGKNTF